MHCENRVGVKIFTVLLEEGLYGAQDNNLDCIDGDTIKKREQMYVEKIHTIVCDEILGSPGNRTQWEVPLEK